MKKMSFTFDMMIAGLLFGNCFSTKEFFKAGYLSGLTAIVLIGIAIVLLFTSILKRNKY